MFGRASKAAMKTRTGRRAAIKGARGVFRFGRSDTGKRMGKTGAKGLGRLVRGAAKVKAGKKAGKAGVKGLARAGRGAGKYAARRGRKEVKVAEKNLSSRSSAGGRLMKFVMLVIAGLSLGALLGRLMNKEESQQDDSFTTASADRPSAGDNADTDSQRAHSEPSSGPLIGTDHEPDIEGVTEDQPDLEQRIRTSIGEDERASDISAVNVEVNEGVAELRGVAPSEEAKEAVGEIAAEVEGIKEVRNLIEVES